MVAITEGQFQHGSLTLSLLIHIHTVNIFRDDCKTNLLLILVPLKSKYNKCCLFLQFVEEGGGGGLEYGTLHVLFVKCVVWDGWGGVHQGI